ERRGGVLEELGHDASLFERRAQLPCSSVSTADDENAPPHDANSFPFDDEATSFGDDGIHGDVVWRPGCLRDELKIVDDGAAECTREARQDPIVEAASPADAATGGVDREGGHEDEVDLLGPHPR